MKRTRLIHEMLFLVLNMLKKDAYVASEGETSQEQWSEKKKADSPTFFYWDLIMRLQMLVLMFVRSIRERSFDLYVNCLERLVPIFFALDATNYACWLPFHLRDMKNLPTSIRQQFQNGDQ